MSDDCVFCRIVSGDAPATLIRAWHDAIAIIPLNPVVPGHVLVLPREHVRDATVDPVLTARTMAHAAELAQIWHSCNLITSIGEEATQSVFHLHIHLVPRAHGDGLALPWTGQQGSDDDRSAWKAYAPTLSEREPSVEHSPPRPVEPLYSAQDDIALGLRPPAPRRKRT